MANKHSNIGSIRISFNPNRKITKCTWTFQQSNLRTLNNMTNGDYIKSNYFETIENEMSAKWYLRCYPKGYNNKYNGHCQMFLYLSSLPNAYKSIKIYCYMKYMKDNASLAYSQTFTKKNDGDGWDKSPLLSELQNSNQIVFELEIRILNIINKNNSPIYGLSIPLSSINEKHQIKCHFSNELLNSFKHWNCNKSFCDKSFPVNMFDIYCYPNGCDQKYKGNVSLFVTAISFPNGIQCMKLKYTIKCPQLNVSKTGTDTFTEKKNTMGWGKYCLANTFIESGPLDIICDIQIIELNNSRHVFKETQTEKKDTDIIDEKQEKINNKENKISKHEQMIQTLQNEKQSIQKKLDELTQVKETQMLSLQKDNEMLRNSRGETQQMNTTLKTQINQLKIELDETTQTNLRQQQTILEIENDKKTIQNKFDEIRQANLRQQQTILDLKNLNKEEEEKTDNNKQKYFSKILIDLENEIEIFKQNYNKQKLNEIFDKNATELIENNSQTNVSINKYNNNNANIILSCQSFNKYINNLQSFIKQISKPNINKYKTWNLEEIMLWTINLDNGKYIKYSKQLKNGFKKSQILSGDLLPELTRADLSVSPFDINEFIIKRDLEKHFKSLLKYNHNEGGQTQYIDK